MLGRWLGWSASENETREHGEVATRLFASAEGPDAQRAPAKKKSPSLFIPKAGDVTAPRHGPGQGAHSSPLANLKRIVTGRRGKGGAARHFSQNGEQNAVTKISFDRQDIMLLSTTIRAGGKRQALNNPHQTHLCKNNAQGLLSLQATHPPHHSALQQQALIELPLVHTHSNKYQFILIQIQWRQQVHLGVTLEDQIHTKHTIQV